MPNTKTTNTWPRIRPTKDGFLVDWRFMLHGAPHGRRQLFDTAAKAKECARLAKLQRDSNGTSALQFSRQQLADLERALQILQPYPEASLTDAAQALADQLAIQALTEQRTIAQLIAEFTEDFPKWSRRGSAIDSATESHLKRLDHTFGSLPCLQLTTAALDAWLPELKLLRGRKLGEPISARLRENIRLSLISLFNFAIRRGYCVTNPAESTRSVEPDPPKRGVLTPEQARALLVHSDPHVLAYHALGLFAGLRVSEIHRLDWADIDLAERLIHVRPHRQRKQNHAARYVSIPANLAAWLTPIAQRSGPVTLAHHLNRTLHRHARAAAGIDPWPANALRHSYASYHLAHHQNQPQLALEMGHTSPSMLFTNYRHLVKPAPAAAYWQIMPDQSDGIASPNFSSSSLRYNTAA